MTPFESGIAACTALTSPNALAVSVSASSNFHERKRHKTRLIAVSFPSPIQAPTCRELSRGERPCRPVVYALILGMSTRGLWECPTLGVGMTNRSGADEREGTLGGERFRLPRVGQRCCEAGDGDRRVVDVRDRLRLLGDERLPEKEPGACGRERGPVEEDAVARPPVPQLG